MSLRPMFISRKRSLVSISNAHHKGNYACDVFNAKVNVDLNLSSRAMCSSFSFRVNGHFSLLPMSPSGSSTRFSRVWINSPNWVREFLRTPSRGSSVPFPIARCRFSSTSESVINSSRSCLERLGAFLTHR